MTCYVMGRVAVIHPDRSSGRLGPRQLWIDGGHLPKVLSPHRRQAGSHKGITRPQACVVPVGAALAGDGLRSGPNLQISTLGR